MLLFAQAAQQAAHQAAQHAAQQAAQQQLALKKEIDSDFSENELPPEKKICFDDTSRYVIFVCVFHSPVTTVDVHHKIASGTW